MDGCAIFYKPDKVGRKNSATRIMNYFIMRVFLKFDLEDFLSVEYKQPNIDILDRDNIALMAKFRPKIT